MCVCTRMRSEGPIVALISSLSLAWFSLGAASSFLFVVPFVMRLCRTERRGIDDPARREGGRFEKDCHTRAGLRATRRPSGKEKGHMHTQTHTQTQMRAGAHCQLRSSYACTRTVFFLFCFCGRPLSIPHLVVGKAK